VTPASAQINHGFVARGGSIMLARNLQCRKVYAVNQARVAPRPRLGQLL